MFLPTLHTLLVALFILAFLVLIFKRTRRNITTMLLDFNSLVRGVFSSQGKDEFKSDCRKSLQLIYEGLVNVCYGVGTIGVWLVLPFLLVVLLLLLPFKILIIAYMD